MFDPEIEKDDGELFLNIVTELNPEEAILRLREIDTNWLIPNCPKIPGFNLNLRFV